NYYISLGVKTTSVVKELENKPWLSVYVNTWVQGEKTPEPPVAQLASPSKSIVKSGFNVIVPEYGYRPSYDVSPVAQLTNVVPHPVVTVHLFVVPVTGVSVIL